MNPRLLRFLLVLALSLLSLSLQQENAAAATTSETARATEALPLLSSSSSSVVWKCDDLLLTNTAKNGLCTVEDLILTTGQVQVLDYPWKITYYRYDPPKMDNAGAGGTSSGPSSMQPIPILVVGGGPGIPHNGYLPLRQLACPSSDEVQQGTTATATTTITTARPVIFYDVAGTGRSQYPYHNSNNNQTTTSSSSTPNAKKDVEGHTDYSFLLENVSYYAETELPVLIDALQLEQFHLVSHSFGTPVALQYALWLVTSSSQEEGDTGKSLSNIVSMTLHSPILSLKEYWEAGWNPETGSIGTMPLYFQQRYRQLMAAKQQQQQQQQQPQTDSLDEEFGALQDVLFSQFIYKSGIATDCLREAVQGANRELRERMFGVSDWLLPEKSYSAASASSSSSTTAGTSSSTTITMKDLDLYPRLGNGNSGPLASLPILLTYGEFDTVRPPTMEKLHSILTKSEVVRFPGAAHWTVLDAAAYMVRSIRDFVSRVETAPGGADKFVPKATTIYDKLPPLPFLPSDSSSSSVSSTSTSSSSTATTTASTTATTAAVAATTSGFKEVPPPPKHRRARWLVFFFACVMAMYAYSSRLDSPSFTSSRYRYETVV